MHCNDMHSTYILLLHTPLMQSNATPVMDHVRIAICHPNYDKLCNLFDYGQLKNDYPFMS